MKRARRTARGWPDIRPRGSVIVCADPEAACPPGLLRTRQDCWVRDYRVAVPSSSPCGDVKGEFAGGALAIWAWTVGVGSVSERPEVVAYIEFIKVVNHGTPPEALLVLDQAGVQTAPAVF